MPKLDRLLQAQGTTFENNFASTPLCCPGRASILTGMYAHDHRVLRNATGRAKVPGLVDFDRHGNRERVVAKWLQEAGYRTGLIGKYFNRYEVVVDRDTDGDGLSDNDVPPYWDSWHAIASDDDYYWFRLVERDGTTGRADRVCYAGPGNRRERPDSRECLENADRVDDRAENYSTDVLADRAVEFVTRAAADGVPFFLYLAPFAPHIPSGSPARYQPDPEKPVFTPLAMERLGACSLFDWVDRPPSFQEADVSDKPHWVTAAVGKVARERFDQQRRLQLVSALGIEDALEKVLVALDGSGQRQNTVVIYTSDNGYSWGEHWYGRKNCAYDSCSRVPLVIYDPRFPREAAIQRELVQNIDLAPTFAELAGISLPPESKANGLSLVGLAHGTAKDWPRDHILTECWGKIDGNCPKGCPDVHASVQTIDWKYIEHYEGDDMKRVKTRSDGRLERELYHLAKDPSEIDNLLLMSDAEVERRGYTRAAVEAKVAELQPKLEAAKQE